MIKAGPAEKYTSKKRAPNEAQDVKMRTKSLRAEKQRKCKNENEVKHTHTHTHTHTLKSATPKNPHRKPPALNMQRALSWLTQLKRPLQQVMAASRKAASSLTRGRTAPTARPDRARREAANPERAARHAVQKRKTIQRQGGPAEKHATN